MDEKNEGTLKHIHAVRMKIQNFILQLHRRGYDHDVSKLLSPEAEIFERFAPLLSRSTYGSPEYNQFLADMKPAIDHHYSCNRHHPEHFESGISGMTLIDLVEMFCDWQAAVLRHDDGDILQSIEINAQRFGISDQLKQILINTAFDLQDGRNELLRRDG